MSRSSHKTSKVFSAALWKKRRQADGELSSVGGRDEDIVDGGCFQGDCSVGIIQSHNVTSLRVVFAQQSTPHCHSAIVKP